MPKDKDLKRRIRARMEKTAESYTAARAQILRRQLSPLPDDYAALAGQSDETMKARTGRTWPDWVRDLDEIGATEMSHREIARWVHDRTGLDWWSQAVTVGYERIRGLRDVGQRRDGTYEGSKSRTISASADAVFDAFTDDGIRRRWLDEGLTVRSAKRPKSARITWPDGTDVTAWITPKGPARTSVAVTHAKLPSREAMADSRAFWHDRLGALKELLE